MSSSVRTYAKCEHCNTRGFHHGYMIKRQSPHAAHRGRTKYPNSLYADPDIDSRRRLTRKYDRWEAKSGVETRIYQASEDSIIHGPQACQIGRSRLCKVKNPNSALFRIDKCVCKANFVLHVHIITEWISYIISFQLV